LADGLTQTDGQSGVVISARGQLGGYERFARDVRKRLQDARLRGANAPRDAFTKPFTGLGRDERHEKRI
jgi:hypothetical protein